ncbi:unnamed protein product [Trichobilharzia szidati]|nr:unnamed protein product [Trichobilharzia szidati]
MNDRTIEGDRINASLTPSTRTSRSRRSERVFPMEQTKSHTDSSHGGGGLEILSANSTYVYTYASPATLEQTVLPLQGTNQTYYSSSGYGSETAYNGSWIKRIQYLWKKLVRSDTSQVNLTTAAAAATTTHSRLQSDSERDRSKAWLAKHMFGLERETVGQDYQLRNTDYQFVSSDAEDDDNDINGTKNVPTWIKSHLHSKYLSEPSSMRRDSVVRTYAVHVMNSLRNLTIQILAFIMAFIYAIGNIFMNIVGCLPRVYRWLLTKLISSSNEVNNSSSTTVSSNAEATWHPSSLRFRSSHKPTSSSFAVQDDPYAERQRNDNEYKCLPWLLPAILILLPLLLILSMLFSPIDGIADNSSLGILPIFSDANCTSELSEPRPNISHLWSLFSWRARCLYSRYFLSSELDDDVSNGGVGWLQWMSFSPPSKSDDHTPMGTDFGKVNFNEVTAKELMQQLTTFSQSVNKRLDQLSQIVKTNAYEVVSLRQESFSKSDVLNLQINEMRNAFNQHLDDWRQFYGRYDHSDNNNNNKDKKTIPNVIDQRELLFLQERERLLQAVNEAVNHKIEVQWNALRREIIQDRLPTDNISLSNMSILLNSLHDQLHFRSRQAQFESQKLRLLLMRLNNDRSQKFANLEGRLLQLQTTVHLLTLRLSDLERASKESKSALMYIEGELKKCSGNEALVNQCHEDVIKHVNTVIENLSRSLSVHSRETFQQTVINELKHADDDRMDSFLMKYMRQAVSNLTKQSVNKLIHDHENKWLPNSLGNEINLAKMIDDALHRFAADRTGLPDYALESAGGSIIGIRCTKTYTEGASLLSIFGLPLVRLSNSPRTILQPGNNPGDCWPFHGSKGQVIIRLSNPINITSVTLEHLPKELAPTGRLDSAPKDFLVKALQSEYDEDGVVLGTFMYDVNDKPLQTFPVKEYSKPVQFIELVILSNHGHPKYTCIYRFRVHGNMVTG